MSAAGSELVKRAAVARFFEVAPEEVERMVVQDRLPVVELPGPAKPRKRVFLPDLHAWVLRRNPESALRDYAVFLKAFRTAQAGVAGGKEAA